MNPELHTERLGQILLNAGAISPEHLEEALRRQNSSGTRLGQVLLEMGAVQPDHLLSAIATQCGLPAVHLRKGIVDPKVVPVIPREKAELFLAIALFKVKDTLTVAMADPHSVVALDQLEALTGCRIQPVVALPDEIQKAIAEYYAREVNMDEFLASLNESDVEVVGSQPQASLSELEQLAEDSPIINLVNFTILKAIKAGASDIHIEPDRKKTRVRYRVDGLLRETASHRLELHPAVVSRLKVMASLDIGERRRPQEGRIQVVAGGRPVDLRVSFMPTVLGEKVVLRILDQSHATVKLSDLGMRGRTLEVFKEMLQRPHGLILVTGPTGSGKTTTLYSALSYISSLERNIVTIEEPVEYQLELINQIQVNRKVNLTFANVLRYVLRQDPDVIMVGEIRDLETAELAVQAALTGHLVISTLHTNDSAATVTRLLDMGLEPYLVSSALTGVIAQRLVRTICPHCKTSYAPPAEQLARIGWPDRDTPIMARGTGCADCFDSGFKGRIGIFEALRVDEEVSAGVLKSLTVSELRALRARSGLPSLKEAGFELAKSGITTIEEVLRAVFVDATADIEPAQPAPRQQANRRPNSLPVAPELHHADDAP